MILVGEAEGRLQEACCLYVSQRLSVECGRAIIASVPLRLSA